MSRAVRVVPALVLLGLAVAGLSSGFRTTPQAAAQEQGDALDRQFATTVQPFLARYCHSCHGPKKQAASLDLSLDVTPAAVVKNVKAWELAFERVHTKEMPPETSTKQPTAAERAAVVKWFREVSAREAEKHAGDPGTVLARRLSAAEFDYTVRDLTGVDIRPTREFPVDPANQSGFDNSGESLAMSPALLKKYLAAARHVADHVVLKPEGLVFASHPAVTDTDRDKYAVGRILEFYKRREVDLADYFLAAWRYRHRAKLGKADASLAQFAADAKLSAKYLALVWQTLTEPAAPAGPLAVVKHQWDALPVADPAKPDGARGGCSQLRDLVMKLRRQLKPTPPKLTVSGMSDGTQSFILARNRFVAANRRSYTGELAADFKKLAGQVKGDAATLLAVENPDAATERKLRADLERFCGAFPDFFVMADRSTNSSTAELGKNRPLTAGFHLMQGYFRDDAPLCDLILTDRERKELDALWFELDFVTLAPMRQYKDYIFFERAEPPRFMFEAEFDFARSEDKDCTSEAKVARLEAVYIAKARKKNASDAAIEAIRTHFATISAEIRRVEKARLAAEPGHLDSLVMFAQRAYRRPLKPEEKTDLLAFYRQLRTKGELGHEDAIRDCVASVLLSPHVCYRADLAQPGAAARPLDDYELASRLSYFLWSSMPDEELLARAAAGDLHRPEVLKAQARRMLRDPKVRGLATEFAGNLLDFRRFEEHNAVDRERFPQFTSELRSAMFEEPVRYFVDVAQKNRPVLDLLHGTDTFVNRPLAKHYGMPEPPPGEWVHVERADRFGRGGILPMAVFQTKNAPGLRTSPVKRGYWVVSKVLGERIPPPPPTVPELPKDEANLGDLTLPQVLARHRADRACAGCHDRFDAVGVVFEGFGPVGELRAKDLGGKPVAAAATFPDAKERTGLPGLREYLRHKRQDDFLDNLCRKLLSYALGRSLLLSDQKTLAAMKARLVADGHAFGSLVESVVTSPQFLNKRGKDDARE
jgi:hypothetical protein